MRPGFRSWHLRSCWPSSSGSSPTPSPTPRSRRFPGGAAALVIAAFPAGGHRGFGLGVFGAKAWGSLYFTPPAAMPCRSRSRPDSLHSISATLAPMESSARIHADQINEASGNFFGLDTTNDQDSKDDIVTAEMAIPVNREIHLLMHLEGPGTLFLRSRIARSPGLCPGAGSFGAFHGDQDRQVRDRLHPALWTGTLHHEGVSGRAVAGGLRQLAEAAGGLAVAVPGRNPGTGLTDFA